MCAMSSGATVKCVVTPLGVFVSCPVCRAKRLLRILPETSGKSIVLYCRKCRNQTVVDIQPGEGAGRVTIAAPVN